MGIPSFSDRVSLQGKISIGRVIFGYGNGNSKTFQNRTKARPWFDPVLKKTGTGLNNCFARRTWNSGKTRCCRNNTAQHLSGPERPLPSLRRIRHNFFLTKFIDMKRPRPHIYDFCYGCEVLVFFTTYANILFHSYESKKKGRISIESNI